MARLLYQAACCLAALSPLAWAWSSVETNQPQLPSRTNLDTAQVQAALSPLLCSTSSVFGPDSPLWPNATSRYQAYEPPKIKVVVRVGCEEDVATVVRYANENDLPFFTVNRAHSMTTTPGQFYGLEIDMQLLTGIDINPDGESARFQGGTFAQEVIDVLWEQGYVATTGSCGCVGMVGLGLGGGHGRLQGRHGMVSDNYLSLNVVLANGTTITVSDTSHPDLFWGMKGAGHNFGVVTSFELRIFPRQEETWYYRNYVFSQTQLEPLFEELNRLQGNGTQPVDIAWQYTMYQLDPTVSATEAIILWSFAYSGPEAAAQPHLAPFDALHPLRVDDGNVPYTEIPNAQKTGVNDSICAHGLAHMVSTAGLQVYNVTAQRAIYDVFSEMLRSIPAFNASVVLMEGYSLQGVLAVDPASSAYPFRDDYLLMWAAVTHVPDDALDDIAIEWAGRIRDLWNEGQPTRRPTTYVNYAFGTESLDSMYGYERWRLERLRALKREYDPDNRFAYFNPIPV
ncbi:FAD-binding oxidoreductase [Aspergillus brunneoviolaceus CBS 621.78]|uniref:FAD-binding domain-containing protein n=1 Tax=Aspergillus brunneoviolaceus CBS 621.78 TaxID=1450534 RepID=A0ACD1GEL3_9EURO|nr:FAD-binding domain-containing protein [Aspergillus brunneoviolaceus CBS 621.78]RAH47729.1 FAD-binding domain-containing protein [Aspergillus brunneoviolaceus CBS 621.78]